MFSSVIQPPGVLRGRNKPFELGWNGRILSIVGGPVGGGTAEDVGVVSIDDFKASPSAS